MDHTRGIIAAALVLALAVLGGSYLVKSSLDRGARDISASLAEVQTALRAAPRPVAAEAAPAPARRGPDPARRHTVDVASAPARGPVGARVKLVEFSDFQ